MRIELPYPHKALWPNGRAHWATKSRQTSNHRQWAHTATLEALQTQSVGEGPYAIKIVVFGNSRGPLPDADNVVAASKSVLDGIADALGVNDRHFKAPTVEFAETREGRFVFEVLG